MARVSVKTATEIIVIDKLFMFSKLMIYFMLLLVVEETKDVFGGSSFAEVEEIIYHVCSCCHGTLDFLRF